MVTQSGVLLCTVEAGGKWEVAEVEKGSAADVTLSIGDNSGAVSGVVVLPENEKCGNISFVNGIEQ